jgi:hypothetical protein
MKVQNDRIQRNSPQSLNREMEHELRESIRYYSIQSKEVISERIHQLEKEWHMDRMLLTNAATVAGIGIVLAATISKRWLILPGVVMSFLLQHGLQGWCPPLPLFRNMGVRSYKEIDRERYALKYLRGDYGEVNVSHYRNNPDELLVSVSK